MDIDPPDAATLQLPVADERSGRKTRGKAAKAAKAKRKTVKPKPRGRARKKK